MKFKTVSNNIVILFFFICCIPEVFGVTGKLEMSRFFKIGGEYYVMGYEPGFDRKVFIVKKIDQQLNEVKTFTQQLPEGWKNGYYFSCKNGGIMLDFNNRFNGKIVRLDMDLNLLSDKDYIKKQSFPFMLKKVDQEFYYTPLHSQYYIGDHVYDLKKNVLFSYTYANKGLWDTLSLQWTAELEKKNDDDNNSIILVSSTDMYLYNCIESQKNKFSQFIYCIDLASGKIKYKTALNDPTKNIFTVSNASYDPAGKLILFGDYTELSDKNKTTNSGEDLKVNGFFIGAVDDSGVFKLYQQFAFSKSNINSGGYASVLKLLLGETENDPENQMLVFHSVKREKDGHWTAFCENYCRYVHRKSSTVGPNGREYTPGYVRDWKTIGISVIRFDEKFNIIDEQFSPSANAEKSKEFECYYPNIGALKLIANDAFLVKDGVVGYPPIKQGEFLNFDYTDDFALTDYRETDSSACLALYKLKKNVFEGKDIYFLFNTSGQSSTKILNINDQLPAIYFINNKNSLLKYSRNEKTDEYEISWMKF